MLCEDTPVEQYQVSGHTIHVKRDDLFGQYPAPPLAKLRGAQVLLKKLKGTGVKKVGVFDTRVSKAGQGIAYLCKELKLECMVGFPLLKGDNIAKTHEIALDLGARLFPMPAGRTAVCYYQFKKRVEENGGYMLPLGLVCKDTVTAVARVVDITLRQLEKDGIKIETIVVCTGTGTIATGIALGADARIIGVSCGMSIEKQWKRMRQLAFPEVLNLNFLKLIPPEYAYYTPAWEESNCPFPTSPYYDAKAWIWLVENIDKLEQPVMFWNIGQ